MGAGEYRKACLVEYSDDVDGFVVLVSGRGTNISEIPSASVFRLDCPKRRYRSDTDFGRWISVTQWSNAAGEPKIGEHTQ
jgi:hypothetical protein